MKNITFTLEAFEQFNDWVAEDKKVHRKIIILINDILRQPFAGLGKPEPLKHELSGYWSRRITDEHRLVYEVTDTEIIILSCRFHYDD
ncbi:Txe/YoeB family addiction module toxin [Kamptonema animale CS-326]|jgi:toxin YoeB|uniref:Txe/YoeB family addiction module toxin n=1 Tax=Kamptonema animale TaxID=92934 RepID=UPI00232B0770|nr:Txe/YoeB family addiction module toxin [Kamptonema animale]MDB9515266.1 Txe/YoeB family addiction module toxin [Kamptonema animale CS-326]